MSQKCIVDVWEAQKISFMVMIPVPVNSSLSAQLKHKVS